MDLFDTHFHLPEDENLDNYLDELAPEHSYQMLTLGGSLSSSIRALEFAEKHDNVWCACGVHPHDAEEFDGSMQPFEKILSSNKVKAVGEIGLDFFYDLSPRALQRQCFAQFLELAARYQKPISVHCRDQEERMEAYNECYAMLKEFAASAGGDRIVLHCYAGNRDFLEKFLNLGCYIGVTGMVTFPKSSNIRDNVLQIPRERLLLETDSPYLAPVPFRGKPNHPAKVAAIALYLADFLGETPEALAAQTTANARRFFNLESQ